MRQPQSWRGGPAGSRCKHERAWEDYRRLERTEMELKVNKEEGREATSLQVSTHKHSDPGGLTCNHREAYFTTHTVTWQFALEGNRLLNSVRHKRSQLDSQDPPLKGLFCYYNVVQWGSDSS